MSRRSAVRAFRDLGGVFSRLRIREVGVFQHLLHDVGGPATTIGNLRV